MYFAYTAMFIVLLPLSTLHIENLVCSRKYYQGKYIYYYNINVSQFTSDSQVGKFKYFLRNSKVVKLCTLSTKSYLLYRKWQ